MIQKNMCLFKITHL